MKENKKGIMGSSMSTIFAIVFTALILSVFFFFMTLVSFSGRGGANTPKFDPYWVESSAETIALLKTPIELQVDGEKQKIEIGDVFKLYSMDKISEGQLKELVTKSLEKSYGSCYGFYLDAGSKNAGERWPLEVSIGQLGTGQFRLHSATVTSTDYTFTFAESYTFCLISGDQQNTLEQCDIACGVKR